MSLWQRMRPLERRKFRQRDKQMPSQLDNIESDIREIKQDVKTLTERVLTLEITQKIQKSIRTVRLQWILIGLSFIASSVALVRLI